MPLGEHRPIRSRTFGHVQRRAKRERRIEGARRPDLVVIAQHLFLTVKPVEMHLASTYRKLDVKRRTELPGVLGG